MSFVFVVSEFIEELWIDDFSCCVFDKEVCVEIHEFKDSTSCMNLFYFEPVVFENVGDVGDRIMPFMLNISDRIQV